MLSLLITDNLNHFNNLLFASRYGSLKDFHVAVYNSTLEVLYFVLNFIFLQVWQDRGSQIFQTLGTTLKGPGVE